MGTTTALRREIKRRFIPAIEKEGFALDERNAPAFWIFRRKAERSVHVFCLQWEKYGRPRFRIDLGTCPLEGLEFSGNRFAWEDMHPHWVLDATTLIPKRGTSSRAWFRQDTTWLRRLFGAPALRSPGEVVDELLALFPEADKYWAEGTLGPHMRQWRVSR
jgi:hypothetical protein